MVSQGRVGSECSKTDRQSAPDFGVVGVVRMGHRRQHGQFRKFGRQIGIGDHRHR
ncbi:Uncharacterised protein [Mycobacteroides abscessus subsp. abscessus]|nr:Uncharacterised protein [Mycobacteroides abscessus subsp. abscessus]